jgi:hypothetical protein
LKLGEAFLYCLKVNLTPEREMVEVVLEFKLLELEKSIDRCKKMVALGSHRAGW